MNSQELSSGSTHAAFDELVTGLARQHTRVRFRNHFGQGGGVFDAKVFARGTVLAPRDKPVSHLLQEQPETVRATCFSSSENGLAAESRTEPSDVTFGELLAREPMEQGLIVRGKRANLFAYVDPNEEMIFVHRVVTEAPPKVVVPQKVVRASRTKRARKAIRE